MTTDVRSAKGKVMRRGLWIVETRTRLRYPRFGRRTVARWGKWSAWRPHIWMDRDLRPLTRQEAHEIATRFKMTTEEFRIARYTP